MTFLSTVLAVVVGLVIWDVIISVIRFGIDKWKDRKENRTRKIGFDSEENGGKVNKGTQMRRIGFGENN